MTAEPTTQASTNDAEEAIRRSAFLRNVCADLVRRADPVVRTAEEMEMLRVIIEMLGKLDDLEVDDFEYRRNRAYALRQAAAIVGNALNLNLDIEDSLQPTEAEGDASPALQARFEAGSAMNLGTAASDKRGKASEKLGESVVLAADGIAREIFELIRWDVLREENAEIASILVETTGTLLGSVFWFARDDEKRGGRHPAPLDEADETHRDTIRTSALKNVKTPQLPFQRSLAARMLYFVCYSMNTIPKEDARDVINFSYSQESIDSLQNWEEFGPSIKSLRNILISFLYADDTPEEEDILLSFEVQERLSTNCIYLIEKMLSNESLTDRQIDIAIHSLIQSIEIFSEHFSNEIFLKQLKPIWRQTDRLIGQAMSRLELSFALLRFVSIPFEAGFSDDVSPPENVVERLRPLLEAGRIDVHGLRHHFKGQTPFGIFPFLSRPDIGHEDLDYLLRSLHEHVGDAFEEAMFASIGSPDENPGTNLFALSPTGLAVLAEWVGADGSGIARLKDDKGHGATMYAIWSAFIFNDQIASVEQAIDATWVAPRLEKTPEDVRSRALSVRGIKLLVSWNGLKADDQERFGKRLATLRERRRVDHELESWRSHDWVNAWRDHDDAVVEATIALASLDIANGGDADNWIAEEGWSMNFASAKELDRRLAVAVLERIRKANDPEVALEDVDRMRRLSVHNDDIMIPTLNVMLEHVLPPDHPARDSLAAEKEAIIQQNAEKAATEKKQTSVSDTLVSYRPEDGAMTQEEKNRITKRAAEPAAWHLPPPFVWTWGELPTDELVNAVERARSAVPDEQEAARSDLLDAVRARRVALPFYEGYELVEIMIDDGKIRRSISMAFGPNAAQWLSGVSPPIHQMNAEVPINLADGIYAEFYLRYFCAYVHADQGPFSIAPSWEEVEARVREDKPLSDNEIAEILEQLEKIAKTDANNSENTQGARVIESTPEGNFLESAIVIYAGRIFRSDFSIQPTGMIEMLEDSPIVGEDKMRAERIVHGWRLEPTVPKGEEEGELRTPG